MTRKMEHKKISKKPKPKGICIYCGGKIDKLELQGFSIICPHCKKIQK